MSRAELAETEHLLEGIADVFDRLGWGFHVGEGFLNLEEEGVVELDLSWESSVELWVIEAVIGKTILCLIEIEDILGLVWNWRKRMHLSNRAIEHHLLEASIQTMQ